jgi:hypothetical protein
MKEKLMKITFAICLLSLSPFPSMAMSPFEQLPFNAQVHIQEYLTPQEKRCLSQTSKAINKRVAKTFERNLQIVEKLQEGKNSSLNSFITLKFGDYKNLIYQACSLNVEKYGKLITNFSPFITGEETAKIIAQLLDVNNLKGAEFLLSLNNLETPLNEFDETIFDRVFTILSDTENVKAGQFLITYYINHHEDKLKEKTLTSEYDLENFSVFCANTGDVALLKRLREINPKLLNSEYMFRKLQQRALSAGHISITQFLIEAGNKVPSNALASLETFKNYFWNSHETLFKGDFFHTKGPGTEQEVLTLFKQAKTDHKLLEVIQSGQPDKNRIIKPATVKQLAQSASFNTLDRAIIQATSVLAKLVEANSKKRTQTFWLILENIQEVKATRSASLLHSAMSTLCLPEEKLNENDKKLISLLETWQEGLVPIKTIMPLIQNIQSPATLDRTILAAIDALFKLKQTNSKLTENENLKTIILRLGAMKNKLQVEKK